MINSEYFNIIIYYKMVCSCPMKGSCKKKSFKKGSASKTRPGRKDFTTKKGSKMFDRGGKRYRTAEGSNKKRLPFVK